MDNPKRVLFIDRDGTLILETADEQIDSFAKLEFYPGALTWMPRIAKELDFGNQPVWIGNRLLL